MSEPQDRPQTAAAAMTQALVDGSPVTVPRHAITVLVTVLLCIGGSGSVIVLAKPSDYVSKADLERATKDMVTRQGLELVIERHNAVPHPVTADLVDRKTRDAGDDATERAVKSVGARLDVIERLIREQGERADKRDDDVESRLRALESRLRVKR